MPIARYAQFSTVNVQLQYLVDNNGSQKTNKFCVIGQKDGMFLAAYVYWETEHQLIFWLPSQDDKDDPFDVADAAIQIDIKHGLREEEDADGGRYQMQRSYAEGILRACQKSGQDFTIGKSD